MNMVMTKEKESPSKQDIPDYIGHRARMKNKVLDKGGSSLTEAELLEVLLMYSIPRRDVKPIAKQLLRKFITLRDILAAEPAMLTDIPGVKDSTVCLLKTIEASCLQMLSPINKKETYLEDWKSVLDFIRLNLSHLKNEALFLIYLNGKKKILKFDIEEKGTSDNVQINPNLIANNCIAAKASYIVLVHNHPAGKPNPSAADIESTKALSEYLRPLSIHLIDHLIVGNNSVYSINNHGFLKYADD